MQYFWRKLRKTYLWEGIAFLRGGGHLATKINITFFCRHRRFEYFLSNIFFEKNNIFQNISKKFFLRGVAISEGTGARTTKMYITFFLVNGVPNTVFKLFFLKKTHTV